MFKRGRRFARLTPYAWSMGAREGSVVQERPERATLAAGLRGKVAVVTGGATGLGRAMCWSSPSRAADVAFCFVDLPGRDVAEQALLTETAIKRWASPCTRPAATCVTVRRSSGSSPTPRQRLGGIHFLVNNAGIANDGALWRLSSEAWREVLDTNVTGAFNCIRAVARRCAAQHYGKIVNIASHQAERPGFGVANYAASKAALVGLTALGRGGAGPLERERQRRRPGIHADRADRQAPGRGPRARANGVGARPSGGAGGRRARDLLPLLRRGPPYHRADHRGGRRTHPRLLD